MGDDELPRLLASALRPMVTAALVMLVALVLFLGWLLLLPKMRLR